nr:Dihydrofolate reductase [uncultured bacterium]
MIRAIAAIDDKRGIAAGGKIPWRIPEDTRYYKEKTEHSTVVMGWATYEEFAEPLPNRRNLVVSRTDQPIRPGFELVTDVDSYLQHATEDIWIIGGAGLFSTTLQYCEELYLTHVAGDFNCDRIFPVYEDAFTLAESSPEQVSGPYHFRYNVYRRT